MNFFKTTATANRKEEEKENGDHGRERVRGQGARNTSYRVGSAIAEEARKVNGFGEKGGGDGHRRGARGRREQEASTDLSEEEDEIADDQIKEPSLEELEELERTLEDDYIPQPSAIVHATSDFTGLNDSTAQAYPPGLGISFDTSPTSPHDTDEESDGTDDDTDDDVEIEIAYVTRAEEQLYRVAPYRRYRVKKYSRLRISWKPIPK